jgi:hypothetical protein
MVASRAGPAMKGRSKLVRLICKTFIGACCFFVLSCYAAGQTSTGPWKNYRNPRWGFCLDYPADWKARFGTDDSGIGLVPPRGSGELRIGGLPDQPRGLDNSATTIEELNHAPPMTLEQNFAVSLSALREYGHASDIVVLEKRALKFQGYRILDTTIEYRVGSEGASATWIERTTFIDKDEVIFTADLKAPAGRFRQLEPVFNEITFHRMRLVCPATP